MGKLVTIRLESIDIGQLLDGLRCRSEAWRGTAEYMDTGYSVLKDFIIEECRDAEEARKIAAHYDRIMATIEAQVEGQGENL
ncbi:MAG: hypothetical protein ABIZ04_13955 [Opitutus sp.]